MAHRAFPRGPIEMQAAGAQHGPADSIHAVQERTLMSTSPEPSCEVREASMMCGRARTQGVQHGYQHGECRRPNRLLTASSSALAILRVALFDMWFNVRSPPEVLRDGEGLLMDGFGSRSSTSWLGSVGREPSRRNKHAAVACFGSQQCAAASALVNINTRISGHRLHCIYGGSFGGLL